MTIIAMGCRLSSSLYALPWLRRSIFSSFHSSTRQHSCRIVSQVFVGVSNTANSISCQVVLLRRLNHNSQNDEESTTAGHTGSTQMDSSTQASSEKRKVDPFAKRPSQKCDPYGLAGQSLSHKECIDWLATLECGWNLIYDGIEKRPEIEEQVAPIFLQRQFYHETFHYASQFLSHISLLSTNLNHYPFLSMERVLVDDLITVSNSNTTGWNSEAASTSGSAQTSKQKRRKVKGWVFVSTVRCSTYRPPTTRADLEEHDGSSQYKDKGLTYHDFHLAMNIDIESNREGCTALLL
mmetsp:Transcript_12180/g.24461  ORF Transcript_12180/g.24461 Transcript_12180/m.24461 type:complete len:294 (-) Transcript_12180:54-935(-)|eukprot:CAMPEP_0113405430 /NCGR_PEP_ID=MMETSP0013_2-20120614/18948_1 /TAXON_ID=2843 ORGANISM="Skeletonema costatum, Strain 1716" /NCGR_SAMPLE_ID=MMETSP0013_2 /ASSEMBLY_ACC=CAM_ASM_000158 /LENGTH=293 /DNA_ID=CAMNT_0000291157 /DNA_START=244 /DNA_END=1125 /DNA_ORIENTATION=+ /assembly_acc=CAM_ASM_000158